ncbi:MAG: hypothetical protein H7318_19065 [Oligoflexus sp.]|nr:hypothetical protein [Oligoflexus sp.]
MVASSFGVIFYVALHTGQSCELAFRDMARATGFKSHEEADLSAMEEFSRAACSTSNPDIIWQLAFQESNFRFQLLRENFPGNMANIYEGEAARTFLNRLGRFDLNRNIDIGVMQFNWAWHHHGFEQDPLRLMGPKAQVEYFLKSFSGEIFDRCHGRWVGCYHSVNDKSRAQKYEQDVLEKGRLLRLHALRYIRKMRTAMAETQRSVLPPILQSDIDKLLEFAREVPIPIRK